MARSRMTAKSALGLLTVLYCLLTIQIVMATSLTEAKLALRQRNYIQAAELLSQLAHTGDAEAQYQLASLYRSGRGVKHSDQQCFYWLQVAANQEHAKAQYSLAMMLEKGRGTVADPAEALRNYRLAASSGHPQAKEKLQTLSQPHSSELDVFLFENKLNKNESLLHFVKIGEMDIITELLHRGASPDSSDNFGHTALMIAAGSNGKNTVTLLLERGAKIDAKDLYGESAVVIATRMENLSMVELLLDSGANMDSVDSKGNTLLHLAVQSRDQKLLDYLLSAGVSVSNANANSETAMDLAMLKGLDSAANLLRKNGAQESYIGDTESTTAQGIESADANSPFANWPALSIAAWRGQIDLIRTLIAEGADVNEKDPDQFTPLGRAASKGHADAAQMLLEAGADIHDKKTDGRTALLLSVVLACHQVLE